MSEKHPWIKTEIAIQLTVSAATVASFALSRFVYNAIGLRALDSEVVGRTNAVLSWSVLISLFSVAGISPAISRALPTATASARQTLVRISLRAAMLFTALSWLGLPLCVLSLGREMDWPALFLAALWGLQFSAYTMLRAAFFAKNEATVAARLELFSGLSFAVSLPLLFVYPGLWWLPFTMYFLPTTVFAISSLQGQKASVPEGFLSFAAIAALGSAASMGIAYGSTLVVASRAGYGQAGIWATLLSFISPLLLLSRTLNTLFLPKLAALHRADPQVLRLASAAHQRLSASSASIVAGLAVVLAAPLTSFALGKAPDSQELTTWQLLCLALFCLVRSEPVVTGLSATGRHATATLAALLAALPCLALWLTLSPSLPSVALGYAVFGVAFVALLWGFVSLRTSSVGLRWYLSDLGFLAAFVFSYLGPRFGWYHALVVVTTTAIALADALGALAALQAHAHLFRRDVSTDKLLSIKHHA